MKDISSSHVFLLKISADVDFPLHLSPSPMDVIQAVEDLERQLFIQQITAAANIGDLERMQELFLKDPQMVNYQDERVWYSPPSEGRGWKVII